MRNAQQSFKTFVSLAVRNAIGCSNLQNTMQQLRSEFTIANGINLKEPGEGVLINRFMTETIDRAIEYVMATKE